MKTVYLILCCAILMQNTFSQEIPDEEVIKKSKVLACIAVTKARFSQDAVL